MIVPTLIPGRLDRAGAVVEAVLTMVEKGTLEELDPGSMRSGFYSQLFLVPKKDGGLRSVINFSICGLPLACRSLSRLILMSE